MTGSTILVLNAGSSSIKFNVYSGVTETVKGQVSGLGAQPHLSILDCRTGHQQRGDLSPEEGRDHETALTSLLSRVDTIVDCTAISAVGHRIVHGGHLHAIPKLVDDEFLTELEKLVPLAPLHQPHNLAGVRAASRAFPAALQVACFDTAFHRGHPWVNDTFALPPTFYDEGVRRYGFHGLSYEYICAHLAENFSRRIEGKTIVAHLGNGASMCAIKNGQSIGSTMGFTALDGLPMGTRCGQIDPGVLLYLLTTKGMSTQEVSDLLYKNAGLKGLSGISQDMRELEASRSETARRAIDYFVFRIRRELGAMAAVLGGVDTLVFTGGIGENSATIRREVCADMDWLGLGLDHAANDAGKMLISSAASSVQVLTIPTNEEEMIRRHTQALLDTGQS
ncbi:acetate/propionate family kinase [Roseibium sp.]|uniref:acetate/propionate family kinase n=1 Tax=Roseibium sp. TaxID=1936156 RepID=UPI003A96AEC5